MVVVVVWFGVAEVVVACGETLVNRSDGNIGYIEFGREGIDDRKCRTSERMHEKILFFLS